MRTFLTWTKTRALRSARIALQAGRRMWDTGGTNLAATLAFYAMLSVYPLLLLVIALISRLADFPASVEEFLKTLEEFAPEYVIETVRGPLESVVSSRGGSSLLFGIGLVLVIWSASGYVGSFGWAANQVRKVQERRRYFPRLLLRMSVALLLAVVLVLALATVGLTENAAGWLGKQIAALGGTLDVWSAIRWPLFAIAATLLLLILFSAGPYWERWTIRQVLPGVVLAVLLWGLASWGFGLYLDSISQYSRIYGTLATVVVFLMWLWLFNLAVLYGVAVNAELQEARQARRAAVTAGIADRVAGPDTAAAQAAEEEPDAGAPQRAVDLPRPSAAAVSTLVEVTAPAALAEAAELEEDEDMTATEAEGVVVPETGGAVAPAVEEGAAQGDDRLPVACERRVHADDRAPGAGASCDRTDGRAADGTCRT